MRRGIQNIALKNERILLNLAEDAVADDYVELTAANNTSFITNRFDRYEDFLRVSKKVLYCDYDFSSYSPGQFSAIVIRIVKEKILTKYLLHQALKLLDPDCRLYVMGRKNEGIKSYKKFLLAMEGVELASEGKIGDLYLLEYRASAMIRLEDNHEYEGMITLDVDEEIPVLSKPGVFSWKRIDEGSRILVDTVVKERQLDGPLIDLGCGCGYLALMAGMRHRLTVCATDSNAAAISVTSANFKKHKIDGKVVAADCGLSIDTEFDTVLSNPPFHRGYGTDRGITERFLHAMKRLCKNSGSCYAVYNRFIQVQHIADTLFGRVELLEQEKGFKVYRFSHPRK